MAAFFHAALVLMILTATQVCGEEPGRPEASRMAVLQGVVQATEFVNHTTTEGLRLHKEHSDRDLSLLLSLSDKVDKITQGISDLRTVLDNRDKTVKEQEDKLADYLQQVTIHSDNENRLNNTVEDLLEENAQLKNNLTDKYGQELETKLLELEKRVSQLENQVTQLNHTAEEQNIRGCTKPPQKKIKKLVQEFVTNNDWSQLRKGLVAVLNHGGEVYKQLQSITIYSMFNIGSGDNYELALMLLCAGLPVETTDGYGETMLNGAVVGDNLRVVELLVAHGADVNKRGSWSSPILVRALYGLATLEVVKALVQAGVDTTLQDEYGSTALEVASSRDKTDIVEYLRQFPH